MQATQTLYRVIEVTRIGFDDTNTMIKLVWEGSDLQELSRRFPPSNIFSADPLGHKEIEGGHIRIDYRFGWKLEDGSWEETDDPRVRLTPMTAMEREIDAENRRLFLGDYVTDDADEYDDPYDGLLEEEPEQFNCDECQDWGCLECEPEKYCKVCECRLSDKETEHCASCKQQSETEYCVACGYELGSGEKDLCAECEELSKPLCFDCGLVHTDPTKKHGEMCKECVDSWREYVEEHYPDPLLVRLRRWAFYKAWTWQVRLRRLVK